MKESVRSNRATASKALDTCLTRCAGLAGNPPSKILKDAKYHQQLPLICKKYNKLKYHQTQHNVHHSVYFFPSWTIWHSQVLHTEEKALLNNCWSKKWTRMESDVVYGLIFSTGSQLDWLLSQSGENKSSFHQGFFFLRDWDPIFFLKFCSAGCNFTNLQH